MKADGLFLHGPIVGIRYADGRLQVCAEAITVTDGVTIWKEGIEWHDVPEVSEDD